MKIGIFFFATAMLSSTLVIGLPLHQTKYSTRQAQEEYLKGHGFNDNYTQDNTFYSPAMDSRGSDSPDSKEARSSFEDDDIDSRTLDSPTSRDGWSSFEGDTDVVVKDTEIRESEESRHPVDSIEQLVRCFQRKSGLPQTGVTNEETRKVTETPSSAPSSGANNRKKRFATFRKWKKTTLTYNILNYNVNRTILNITEQDIRSTIQRAMKFWTDVSGLTVTEKNSTNADIRIGFYAKDHEDGLPFDGRGGKLAHAFYFPDGLIHLDADERWSLYTNEDLLYVVIHEFGHVIGIMHSQDKDSVMRPYVPDFNPNRELAKDDILAVRSLYGLPRDHLFNYVLKYYETVKGDMTKAYPVKPSTIHGNYDYTSNRDNNGQQR